MVLSSYKAMGGGHKSKGKKEKVGGAVILSPTTTKGTDGAGEVRC